LIAGVNDSQDQARELAVLLHDFPCKINLIPFNPFPQSEYQKPSGNAVSRFWQVLIDEGFIVTVRSTRGDDIDAACGQLVGQVVDKTRRAERYRLAIEQVEPVRLVN
jgi:23S rRNA (adenine2503-C2)-methyltransferase